MATFKLACVQISANDDLQANIDSTSQFIRAAHAAGAELIAKIGRASCRERV